MTTNRLIMLLHISKKELTPTQIIVEYAKELEELIELIDADTKRISYTFLK